MPPKKVAKGNNNSRNKTPPKRSNSLKKQAKHTKKQAENTVQSPKVFVIRTRHQKAEEEAEESKSKASKLASKKKVKNGKKPNSDEVSEKSPQDEESLYEDEDDAVEEFSPDAPHTTPKSEKKKTKAKTELNENAGRPKNAIIDMSFMETADKTTPKIIEQKIDGVVVQRFVYFHPENLRNRSLHEYAILCLCGRNGAITTMSKHFKTCKYVSSKDVTMEVVEMENLEAD